MATASRYQPAEETNLIIAGPPKAKAGRLPCSTVSAGAHSYKYGLSTAGITLSGLSSPSVISTDASPGLSQNCTYTSPLRRDHMKVRICEKITFD